MNDDAYSQLKVDVPSFETRSAAVNPGGAIASIRDVAQRADVSPATVSRVLTGSAIVKPETRARVLKAIADLGYRPNQVARNLRRQKAEMIGLVIADVENPFFTEMVRSVEDAAYRLGYRVLLCNTDENVEKQRSYLGVMVAERVLGVILSPSDPDAEEIGELLDLGIPLIAFDRAAADARADSVTTDNLEAGRGATRHLLEAGYERIAFISSPEVVTGVERLAGYEEIMRRAGLRPRSVSGFSRIEGGMAATEKLLADDEPPTALIAGNGQMGIGALKALRARGLTIPRQMAFVMVDDPFWAEITDPPLTALAQPVRQMAERMIELLVDRLNVGRDEPRHVVFDFELRVRASSRAVYDGPRDPGTRDAHLAPGTCH
jgi:DNA-binding LacI/PurR family transcriptional regulator